MGGLCPKTNGKNLTKKKPGFRRARGHSGFCSKTVMTIERKHTPTTRTLANDSMVLSFVMAGLAPGLLIT
jgi:hypothetical protein